MIPISKMLACAASVAIIVACREGKTAETAPARTGKAMVRVLDALPSQHKVDLTGDDHTIFSDVGYKQVTPYAEVKDDLVALRALTSDDNVLLAADREVMLAGVHYTALVLPDGEGGTELRVIRDDIVPGAGKARVRVINASPTVKDSDFAVLGEKSPLFQGFELTDDARYKDVAPATVTLDVRQNTKSVKPMILKPLHLVAGKAYTIVILGGKGAPPEAIAFEDVAPRMAAANGD